MYLGLGLGTYIGEEKNDTCSVDRLCDSFPEMTSYSREAQDMLTFHFILLLKETRNHKEFLPEINTYNRAIALESEEQ